MNLVFLNICSYFVYLLESFVSLRINKEKLMEEQRIGLEKKVMRFMEKADSLKKDYKDLAFRFLYQATKLYHNKLGGYSKPIDARFNEIFLSFMEMYPSI